MSDMDAALIEEATALSKAAGHPYADVLRRLVNALAASHAEAEHLHEEDARERAALRQERDEARAKLDAVAEIVEEAKRTTHGRLALADNLRTVCRSGRGDAEG